MGLLIFYILLALGFSFLCSIMEAALLSVTPSYVARLVRDGNPVGPRLKAMKADIDQPLAAILTLNTIAHTVGAAGAGAQAAVVFGDAYLGLASGVLTLLILVFSEIIPKTLGAIYWRSLTPTVVRLLGPTMFILKPFVWMSQMITKVLARDKKASVFSREEFSAMADLGREAGIFAKDESRMLKNLLRLRQVRAKDIMTPRTVVTLLPESESIATTLETRMPLTFSRYPIFGENRDDITGLVLKTDLLLHAAQNDAEATLKDIHRDIFAVPDTLPIPELLEQLLDRGEHLALVVDEYGGTAGVVTLEDIFETVLGLEIVDEADTVADMQVLAREQWVRRAKRLGIVPPNFEAESDAEAIIQLGLTGEKPTAPPS